MLSSFAVYNLSSARLTSTLGHDIICSRPTILTMPFRCRCLEAITRVAGVQAKPWSNSGSRAPKVRPPLHSSSAAGDRQRHGGGGPRHQDRPPSPAENGGGSGLSSRGSLDLDGLLNGHSQPKSCMVRQLPPEVHPSSETLRDVLAGRCIDMLCDGASRSQQTVDSCHSLVASCGQ